jgi:hypothetical protein
MDRGAVLTAFENASDSKTDQSFKNETEYNSNDPNMINLDLHEEYKSEATE